ncbi:MAG: hypothetical protein COZ06_22590 [Armatimonadetes bacterium CG_4_10_14_3_um_filter_66_18]|nr:type II toxin-antitoxin system VapC family toxin [Armatimonadota bacterium]OIP02752.1 MAG: hypothetical protein AUJ96_15895 [Armatimonadetes bacterium CG2_30_66_41]PIU90659.1 MAG: hypothetical protein COS65_24475 [Armatimonadetes bacterium CG06_land_8_20_14_3_00_66_21]PIW17893.1 MAG: hypothetical protein COW34_04675 [Armatimonadetes bacterium CG17_big_fil_post_rev_8_21_14_2_50_66_6]PIX42329.1 MAG: hypothetical protein COZ57_21445 [Armatimonadetes bacterium CG_4_8_14_3_um_filter_66_20]PIY435
MKLYLDNCALNRPFDDLRQQRVADEARAVSVLLDRVRSGRDTMVDSSALRDEGRACPDRWRRGQVRQLRELAAEFRQIDERAALRAVELSRRGLSAFDALHVSLVESAGADYFVTTDDRLLKAVASMPAVRAQVVRPIVLARKENPT